MMMVAGSCCGMGFARSATPCRVWAKQGVTVMGQAWPEGAATGCFTPIAANKISAEIEVWSGSLTSHLDPPGWPRKVLDNSPLRVGATPITRLVHTSYL